MAQETPAQDKMRLRICYFQFKNLPEPLPGVKQWIPYYHPLLPALSENVQAHSSSRTLPAS